MEKDEDYLRTVANLGAAVEGMVKQNNVIDIYEEYFTGITADHSAEVWAGQPCNVLIQDLFRNHTLLFPSHEVCFVFLNNCTHFCCLISVSRCPVSRL